jgi:4-hydroxybenzoate polyprenyltransferase
MNTGVDQTSIGMAFGTIIIQIIGEATKSDAIFFMGITVGASTVIYNIVKTHKEIKRK